MAIAIKKIAPIKNNFTGIMQRNKLLLIAIFIFCSAISFAQINLIPFPNELKYTNGKFKYDKGFDVKTIRGDETTRIVSKQLTDFFTAKKIPIVQFSPLAVTINLLKENTIPNDGYTMSILPNTIAIASSSNAGLFYGLQSLFQLFRQDTSTYKKGKLDTLYKTLPCAEIKDVPAFSFRGFGIDVCNNFFPIEILKEYIDEMAKLKFNQLHVKLVNENICRLKLDTYKKIVALDSLSLKKAETENNNSYSKAEINDLVKYAKDHFINIIPEINFSYLAEIDTNFQVQKNSMDEVLAMFPSNYLHTGNQSYFRKDLIDYLTITKSKKIISTDNKLATNSMVQSYKNNTTAFKAAQNGIDVILSPKNLTALDNYQYWDDSKLSKNMLYLPLDKTYNFDPLSKIKDDKIVQHILGGEATLNTTFYKTKIELQKIIFPRLYAIAECLWTKKSAKTSFKNFNLRLEKIGYPGQPTEKIDWVKFK